MVIATVILANLKNSVSIHILVPRGGGVLKDEDTVFTISPPSYCPNLVCGMKRGWLFSSEEDKTPSPPHQRRRLEWSYGEGQEVRP